MEELGFADQRNDCEIKFKNMKRTYISTVDDNNTSGNDRKTCAYFDEMNKLFQKDARIQPVAVCSSRAGTKKTAESTSEKDATCSVSENDTFPSKRKRKKNKASDDLVSLFKHFTKTQEERKRETMQELKDMHTEKMTMMGRFLQVFDKSFEKDLKNPLESISQTPKEVGQCKPFVRLSRSLPIIAIFLVHKGTETCVATTHCQCTP